MAKKKKVPSEIIQEFTQDTYYTPCRWVAQFDDDKPLLFSESDINSDKHEITIKIDNNSKAEIVFSDPSTGKRFRIFTQPKN